MTTPDGLTAFAEGVAMQIAARADVVRGKPFAWSPTAGYTAGQRGLYLGIRPTSPDEIVTLNPRPLTADPTLADAEYALQVWIRGTKDPRTAWDVRDAIRAVLTGRWPTTLPNGYEIRVAENRGGASMGPDLNDRVELTDNYVFAVGEQRARPF